jgi:hypothetical protein
VPCLPGCCLPTFPGSIRATSRTPVARRARRPRVLPGGRAARADAVVWWAAAHCPPPTGLPGEPDTLFDDQRL